MKTVRKTAELRRITRQAKRRGKRIGFVPTMGGLHEGHLSLIRRARRENDLVVVSLFVNPIQFSNPSDLKSYPRTPAKDRRLAAAAGCDLLFVPSAAEIYPPGFQTFVEVTELTRRWEGKLRPGHFRGVTTVVAKLFNLVQPEIAYFGQKDAQQAVVVGRMIRDLGFDVRLKVLPTVREPGGLAMSSRNARLSPDERRAANRLFESLQEGKRLIEWGLRRENEILRRMRAVIRKAPGARVEYLAVVDPHSLEPLREIKGSALLLAAAWVGKTRLIDGCLVKPKPRFPLTRE